MTTDPQAGALMRKEIHEQPESLQRLLDHGVASIGSVAEVISARQPRFVIFAARGTSDHAAQYAKYLIEIRLGLPVGLASPSTMTGYDSRPQLHDVLWIAVSQSGGSPDLVDSTRTARECGALTVAVTNARGSDLDRAAELHIDIMSGPEKAVAATKSYTSELLALYLLVDALAGGDGTAVRQVPDHVAAVLSAERAEGSIEACTHRYRFVERLITTGRGYAYPTALESALKLMETTYLSAHAFSAADLMHGPFATIDRRLPVIAFAPEGAGSQAIEGTLDRLRDRGADVLLVGDERVLDRWRHTRSTRQLSVPAVPEVLAPMVQIVPAQLLALGMAVARGQDPDAPRGLAKVTKTH
jgi:glucosamine--fructose-6-phosphate aminotransferase (isomerizing)